MDPMPEWKREIADVCCFIVFLVIPFVLGFAALLFNHETYGF